MPNYPMNQPWQQQTNFTNYQQTNAQQVPFQNAYQQPQPQMRQSPVMSIAPVRGFDNMIQFPVAVGTDLYLLDLEAMKLYRKCNPTNPREFEEFDLSRVINTENQNEPVSRAELDEMKSMMAQMMNMIQTQQDAGASRGGYQQPAEQPMQGQQDTGASHSGYQQRPNQKYNGKRGGRHDGSGNVPANDG